MLGYSRFFGCPPPHIAGTLIVNTRLLIEKCIADEGLHDAVVPLDHMKMTAMMIEDTVKASDEPYDVLFLEKRSDF
ncbi:MAG: hypothetical protein K5673_08530 [Lachnospiraceae bacterium]|nr:hypothetical protein [Lachnospiraceae bacterium]